MKRGKITKKISGKIFRKSKYLYLKNNTMKTINEYKNRFDQLMESTIGNVKPLINETDEEDIPTFSLNNTKVNRTPGNTGTESADLSHKVEWRCKNKDINGQIVEILSNPPATFNYTAEGADNSKKNLSIPSSVAYDRLKKENLLRHCTSKGYK